MNWRLYLIILLLALSVIDLSLTFIYINKYRHWQPNKPYNLMENNPLLVFLWNNFGLILGMFIGSVIILSLIYLIGRGAHWLLAIVLILVLCWAIYNHFKNFDLLNKLISTYPLGYLPESIFGIVIGNNPKPKKWEKQKADLRAN